MNEFQNTESGAGILKENYDMSPLAEALKRKRLALAKGKGMDLKENEEENSNAQ